MNEKKKIMSTGRAWGIFIVLFLTQIVFSEALMKPAGVMVFIMQDTGVSVTGAGLLMTINGIGAAIITLVGSGLMQKVGVRKIAIAGIIMSILAQLIAVIWGAQSYALLLVMRFFEGGSYGIISTAMPAMIAAVFPVEKRGAPNAIYTLNISFAMIIILNSENVFGYIAPNYAWLGAWLYCMIQVIILGFVFFLVAKVPAEVDQTEATEGPKPKVSDALKAVGPWCVVIIMFVFSVCNGAWSTYYPTYLQQALGMDAAAANVATTADSWASIIGAFVAAFILLKVPVKKRAMFMLIITILYVIVTVVMFDLPGAGWAVPYLIVYGIVAQFMTPSLLTLIPDVAVPGTVPVAMGLYVFAMSVGGALSSVITGPFVDASGNWANLTIPFAILLALALIGAIVIFNHVRKQSAKVAEA